MSKKAKMMSPAKVKKLRQFASARIAGFRSAHGIIDAVSVAEKDMSKAADLLKGEKPLWPKGSCNEGMAMWIALRTWYPCELTKKMKDEW